MVAEDCFEECSSSDGRLATVSWGELEAFGAGVSLKRLLGGGLAPAPWGEAKTAVWAAGMAVVDRASSGTRLATALRGGTVAVPAMAERFPRGRPAPGSWGEVLVRAFTSVLLLLLVVVVVSITRSSRRGSAPAVEMWAPAAAAVKVKRTLGCTLPAARWIESGLPVVSLLRFLPPAALSSEGRVAPAARGEVAAVPGTVWVVVAEVRGAVLMAMAEGPVSGRLAPAPWGTAEGVVAVVVMTERSFSGGRLIAATLWGAVDGRVAVVVVAECAFSGKRPASALLGAAAGLVECSFSRGRRLASSARRGTVELRVAVVVMAESSFSGGRLAAGFWGAAEVSCISLRCVLGVHPSEGLAPPAAGGETVVPAARWVVVADDPSPERLAPAEVAEVWGAVLIVVVGGSVCRRLEPVPWGEADDLGVVLAMEEHTSPEGLAVGPCAGVEASVVVLERLLAGSCFVRRNSEVGVRGGKGRGMSLFLLLSS